MINPRISADWSTNKPIATFSCTLCVHEVHSKSDVVHLTLGLLGLRVLFNCRTEHRDDLHKAFDTDVGTDDPLIHPKSFCKPCYSVMKTAVKKKEMCVPYKHSVEVFYWTQHQETNCVVSVLRWELMCVGVGRQNGCKYISFYCKYTEEAHLGVSFHQRWLDRPVPTR